MSIHLKWLAVFILAGSLLTACAGKRGSSMMPAAANPNSVTADSKTPSFAAPPIEGQEKAVFAGGCFWGVEAVFEHIKGVQDVTSGYSGGTAATADYERVSGGDTDHAEVVEVTFDPAQVSYERLLQVFFSVAHDPTELNRQGPDTGTQYRSAIFYTNDEQKRIAEKHIAELTEAKVFSDEIVTEITPLTAYYKAENYHQDYLARHPTQAYIVINDLPKLENLRKQFPELYFSK